MRKIALGVGIMLAASLLLGQAQMDSLVDTAAVSTPRAAQVASLRAVHARMADEAASQSSREFQARAAAVAKARATHRKAVAARRAAAAAAAIAAAAAAATAARKQAHAATRSPGYRGVARRVARCESGGRPRAQNRYSSASGLYQFIDSTWRSVSHRRGRAMYYSVRVQTWAFWKLWDHGRGAGHWAMSRHCWG
jgi:hypothetical protein